MFNGYDTHGRYDSTTGEWIPETWAEAYERTLRENFWLINSHNSHVGQTLSVIKTYYPAQPAIAGVSAIPPTRSQINYLMNSGWNSWARTVDEILSKMFVEYTCNVGINGGFVGLGVRDKEGHTTGSFAHGLLVDSTGVWVFEMGVKVVKLRAFHNIDSLLRIVRQDNHEIIYLIITKTETLVYKSLIPVQNTKLYGYGYLYASGDTLNSAVLTVGEVQFGSA